MAEKKTMSQTTIEDASITIQVEEGKEKSNAIEVLRPRPWVRFWARMIDYSLFYLVIWLLGGVFFKFPLFFAHTFFWMVLIFLWAFLEAAFLCGCAKTPGKWLLKTSIYTNKRQKLSYREALSRSFSVWWLGFGAGVPILSWITMIVAAVKLSNVGESSWDKRCETTVYHKKVGPFRVLIAIIYFALYFWCSSWFQVQGFQYQ